MFKRSSFEVLFICRLWLLRLPAERYAYLTLTSWAHLYKKRGKPEESPFQEEARSDDCGRSSKFAEPGWNEFACAQVWPRHQAVALFSELVVKDARPA